MALFYDHKIRPGDVIMYADGLSNKAHTAIVLEYDSQEIFMLFLTSNPYWNHNCRPIMTDELAYFNFGTRNEKLTYLAPVVRPTAHVAKVNGGFPKERVEEFLEEFPRECAQVSS